MNCTSLEFCQSDGSLNVLLVGLKNIAVFGKTVKDICTPPFKWLLLLSLHYYLIDFKQVLIGILAATYSGFVWFIFGMAKDTKTIEDVKREAYKPKNEYDNEGDRDTRIDIIAGIVSVLISPLFVYFLIFAWAVAIQAILGIIFALQAVIGIVQVFKYEKGEFQHRKYNNEINLKNTEINSAKDTAQKIFAWFKQTKPKEEPSKNQETNSNLEYNLPYEQQGTIPAQGTNFSTIIQDEKEDQYEPGQWS